MNQNLLLEILGILIGFSGIMLLLSILVTSLTQVFVYVFNVRARNLRVGLEQLLETALGQTGTGKELVSKVLGQNNLMKEPRGKRLSWIESEELKWLLEDSEDFNDADIKRAMMWFNRMERGLTQRFQIILRWITIGCAPVVAFVFQVSAPDLLIRLSTDPVYRVQAEMAAKGLVNEVETKYSQQVKYEDVSAKALEELQDKHPELRETLEEVSGVGDTKADILDELSLVLEDHPEREALVLEYTKAMEELSRKGYEQAIEMAEESVGKLALFNITPYSKGMKYYWDLSNVFGVLMTAVLIGLGAPFWFNTLKGLVNFRDALAPKEDKKRKGEQVG